MRICLFMTSFLPMIGGAERSADLLARGLIERGHEVMVLAQWTGRASGSLPYPVRHYVRLPKQNMLPEAMAWPLFKAWWSWRFEVVLAFDSYPAGYAAAWLRRWLGVRVIITPRGGDLQTDFYSLKKARVARSMARGYRGANRLIAISLWLERRLHEVAGDDLPPVDVVYNGMDLEEHERLCAESRARPPCVGVEGPFVLHLARVNPHKQQTTAIRAVHALRKEFEARGLRYVIAGDGRGVDEIRGLIDSLDLGKIVLYVGPRGGVERAWLYDRAEFFVTASLGEGFGNVLIEAMASGLPILASDIPASREVLERYPAKRFFLPGDARDMAEQMRCMMEGRERVSREAAAGMVRERFSLGAMIDGYERACLACAKRPALKGRLEQAGGGERPLTRFP